MYSYIDLYAYVHLSLGHADIPLPPRGVLGSFGSGHCLDLLPRSSFDSCRVGGDASALGESSRAVPPQLQRGGGLRKTIH